MHARCFVVHATCLTMGLVIGFSANLIRAHGQEGPVVGTTPHSVRTTPACASPGPAYPQTAQDEPLLLESIRTAIREELRVELAAFRAQPDIPHEEARPSTVKLDAKSEERQRLAYDKASQSLSRAIGYGTWTQEDRQHLRSTLHELSIRQQDQLIGELFGAIQSGRLRTQDAGPPL